MGDRSEKETHFYTRAEFYISVGAFLISLVSLYFSYHSSPLSDITRPQITYKTISGIWGSDEYKHIFIVCEIHNPTKNPAEEVVVSIPIVGPVPSNIRVTGGLEYSVLTTNSSTAGVKFPLLPPNAGATIMAEYLFEKDAITINDTSLKELARFTKVHHKHGGAVEINLPGTSNTRLGHYQNSVLP